MQMPKNVTFARNFSGRAHCAVFKCNNGPGEAILKLCEAIGCSIPSNSKVSAGLLAEQKCFENNQVRCGSAKRKSSVNLGEIIFTSYMKSTKRNYLIEKANCFLKRPKQGN